MSEVFPEPLLPPTLLPEDEARRLEALRRYSILDTPPETAFDRITSLAARLFDVPIALVSLVDESRAWFKSCFGFELQEVQRNDTICSFALLSPQVLVVPDAQQDDRFACNPFVQADPGLRFYAGAPLLTQDGFNLGTLCLLDMKPRPGLTDEQTATLSDLAAMVMDELELRLAARKVAQLDIALLEVTQGLSGMTGDDFFYALVQHFTKTLDVDYTYIGLVSKDSQEVIRTIAACAEGQIIDNFEYRLCDTPCQQVLQTRKLCCYPSGVQTEFPDAPLLAPLRVESYAAIPFLDSAGTPIGLLGVMDSKPLANVQLTESLLTIFALRIATELERQQTERARQQAQQELESLIQQRTVELSRANQSLQLEIAERQQAETALQTEQEMLKVLLDNVQAGIVACDAEGRLTLFNQAAREFHGLPARSLPLDQWTQYYDLYLPDGKTQMPLAETPLIRALQGETVYNVEMVIIPKAGTTRTLLTSGRAISDAQGNKRGAVVVMHDITDRKQAEAELLISDTALQQLPDAILLTDLEGKIQRWLGNAEQIFGYTAVEAIGRPVNFLHDPTIRATMTATIIRSMRETGSFFGEVPCIRKDGSAVPIETTSKTVYDKAGTPLFFIGINKDITERKQAEAERAQLIRQQVQEQTARLEAEAAQQRSAFLVEVSMALAASLDYEQTLQSVTRLAVPYFADWCSVDLLNEDQSISRVAVAHSDPDKVQLAWELAERFPRHLDDGYGISQVMKTGQSEIVIAITNEQLTAAVTNLDYLEILRGIGLKSCIITPLQARGRVLGSISFVFAESDRHYAPADLTLAEDLARRAAIAIDNARLYYTAKQAKQAAETAADRTARLQTVTAALSESLTPIQVAEVIVEQSIAAVGADAALMVLLKQGEILEIVRSVGYGVEIAESQKQFSIHASVPLAEAVKTGEPVWSEPLEQRLVRYPHLAESYKSLPFQAWISLPLMVEGKAVGGLSLSFKQFKQLSQDDREFILTLTRQCAQAIFRAQLYEAERNARAEAEQANRLKDEFLAVLSHELRSPLNPILGWSKLLQNQNHDPATAMRGLQTIERNAKLQTQLIEDLLDVSRILQGKLNLNVASVNLKTAIEAAIETVRLAAEAKAIRIQTRFDPTVGYISGDASRLQQVVWNLLSNAVKFTPQGGQVEVKLSLVTHHWSMGDLNQLIKNEQGQPIIDKFAQITVTDTGQGITPEFLPYIFDRFRQADSKTTRKFGGLGLGLAIVRQLVELHGGTVQASSPGEGQGATFTVRLPLREVESGGRKSENNSLPAALCPLPLQDIRVLIVDDEADARELLAFVLEQAGAIVTSAASAIEALQALTDLEVDVLISDIGMPNMDGYMLMQQVQAQRAEQGKQKGLNAIALTAYVGEINERKALTAGFQRHLSKPIEPTELIAAIVSLI
jgi:PAS domain S-box-containing protein